MSLFCGSREKRVSIYCKDCGRMAFGRVPTVGLTEKCIYCFSSNIQIDRVSYRKKRGVRNSLLSCFIIDSCTKGRTNLDSDVEIGVENNFIRVNDKKDSLLRSLN